MATSSNKLLECSVVLERLEADQDQMDTSSNKLLECSVVLERLEANQDQMDTSTLPDEFQPDNLKEDDNKEQNTKEMHEDRDTQHKKGEQEEIPPDFTADNSIYVPDSDDEADVIMLDI